MAKGATYTVHAGRQIYRNGRPFISIGREGDTDPTVADHVVWKIAAFLNQSSTVETFEREWEAKVAKLRNLGVKI